MPPRPRSTLVERLRAGANPGNVAALAAFVASAQVYVRTLLQGVSFGDWAEAQMIPARIGILHPTGYPVYTILGKLFSMIPVGSVAYRANLLSAAAAALVTCDAVERPLTDVALRRPVYALMVHDQALRQQTGLTPVPVATIRLPWGKRYAELDRTLYRMVPNDSVP